MLRIRVRGETTGGSAYPGLPIQNRLLFAVEMPIFMVILRTKGDSSVSWPNNGMGAESLYQLS